MKKILLCIVSLLAGLVACSSSSGGGVSEGACNGVTPGESRGDVNSALGPVGGGGGNSSECAVWWGDYNNGPCCSVRLTDCTTSGEVTSRSYDPTGCK